MTKYTQMKVSSEDGSVHGSCFRTVIGSILDIDPETIPHWEDMDDWHTSFFAFLERNGYEYEGTMHKKRIEEGALKDYEGVDGYVLVGGKSPRSWVKRGHAVVYYKGEPFHDPHPSGDFITEVEHAMMIRPYPARKLLLEIERISEDYGEMNSEVHHRARFVAKRLVEEGISPDDVDVSGEDTVYFEFTLPQGRFNLEIGTSGASYFIEKCGSYRVGNLSKDDGNDIYNMQGTLVDHLIKNSQTGWKPTESNEEKK